MSWGAQSVSNHLFRAQSTIVRRSMVLLYFVRPLCDTLLISALHGTNFLSLSRSTLLYVLLSLLRLTPGPQFLSLFRKASLTSLHLPAIDQVPLWSIIFAAPRCSILVCAQHDSRFLFSARQRPKTPAESHSCAGCEDGPNNNSAI